MEQARGERPKSRSGRKPNGGGDEQQLRKRDQERKRRKWVIGAALALVS